MRDVSTQSSVSSAIPHFHLREFELLQRYGAACIAHDARMVNFYAVLLGQNRARQVASAELGRPVEAAEIDSWLTNPRRLEALFLGEIAAVSRPMVVHSPVTVREVRTRYGVVCALLPYVPYRVPVVQAANPFRSCCRPDPAWRGGQGGDSCHIRQCPAEPGAPEELIWATAFLRAWGFPVRLVFVGMAPPPVAQHLASIASVHATLPEEAMLLADQPVPEDTDRDWLAAADVGVQLRTYQFGGLSGALLDCMAAGLPTVATAHLAEAISAPAFVRAVPDAISSVPLAETVADIVDSDPIRYGRWRHGARCLRSAISMSTQPACWLHWGSGLDRTQHHGGHHRHRRCHGADRQSDQGRHPARGAGTPAGTGPRLKQNQGKAGQGCV